MDKPLPSDQLVIDLLESVNEFHEYELLSLANKNAEGHRAFQFCRIFLEEKLKKNGIHVGILIEIKPT